MTRPCKVGVQLPEVERFVPWPEYLDLARLAEDVGFDSVWVGDHLIYDLPAAVRSCHHLLQPGGVLLVTGPAVSRVRTGDYWRFTPASLGRLLEESFGQVTVRAYGNVLAATAFLSGMAKEEVPNRLLDKHDEHFPVIVAARAVKA